MCKTFRFLPPSHGTYREAAAAVLEYVTQICLQAALLPFLSAFQHFFYRDVFMGGGTR